MMYERPTHFIGFEASGIAPDSYPIEVAVVHPNGEYQTLIQPARYWDHWSYDAQDMHGLSREKLISEGQSPLEVAQAMNQLFDGKVLCSDNPADCFWLDVLYEAAGIEPTFRVLPLEALIGRDHASQMMAMLPVRKGHRALDDVKAFSNAVNQWFSTT